MGEDSEDDDFRAAIQSLGKALSAALPGATAGEIQLIIDAVDAIAQVRIAQFVELAAERWLR